MEDVLMLGYDKSEGEDKTALAICRVVNGKLIHIKTLIGEDADCEYEMLTHRDMKI